MDGPHGSIATGLIVLLIIISLPLASTGAATPDSLFGVQSVDPDQVILSIDVQPDGDAQWRVEYRVRLDSDNETQAFKDLQADVEENESAYLSDFTERIQGTVDTAENSTGREMNAEGFNVSARITQLPQEYGVLTYTFTWTNFAQTEGDQVIAGDALAGFFLDSETTLTIGWPDDYREASATPEPTERQQNAVVWRGPLDFGGGEPRVVVEPDPSSGTTTDPGGITGPPGEAGGWLGLGTITGILVVLAVLGAAGFLYIRRNGYPGGAPGGVLGGSSPDGGASGTGAGATGADGADGAGGAGAADGGASGDADASQQPPSELLSNEERVIQFLEQEGGRAKQQEIVDGLDWTDAKTSQVLSGMASEDQIEKFRIGRENVVKLPDDDDDDTTHRFEA